ncbi:MAG: site-specific integrase [Mesorhizobium sp.]|nr:MAG: site-specific integrase [Mesorhizobium sp.]
MARTVRDARLDTRAARIALPMHDKPHWRMIEEGFHVGYRKGPRGGKWQARIFVDGKYVEKAIGIADDTADADGDIVLSWSHAQSAGRAWREKALREARGHGRAKANYTVSAALADYLADCEQRGKKDMRGVKQTIKARIEPVLGSIEVDRLTTKKIKEWQTALWQTPAKNRGGKEIEGEGDPRARKVTANRILTTLKAALNLAFSEELVDSDLAWRKVKPFKNVEIARVRYLSIDEQRRLVNACDPEFRALVRGALFTGCRVSELARLRVSDINLDANTVHVLISKSGKPRHVVLGDEGVEFFKTAVAGKAGDAIVFPFHSREWQKSEHFRPMVDASDAAKITPRARFHDLRHTHASALAMAGVPMGVIATQLGHSDTRVTERHYAHLAPSYVADTIRAHFPKLGIGEKSNVTAMAVAR